MVERAGEMSADDGWVWLCGLAGRRWVCDCGMTESGGCHGWRLRKVLEFLRRKERFEWLTVAGEEDEVGRMRREMVLSRESWKEEARRVLADRLSLPSTGVFLKRLLLRRPGRLGEFLRVFPGCRMTSAPSARRRGGRDPMPLPVLEESPAEHRLRRAEEMGGTMGGERRKMGRTRAREAAGFDAWVWLLVMVANYMYCGGEAWEPRLMVHLGGRTEVQEKMLRGHELRVRRFLGASTTLTPASEERPAESERRARNTCPEPAAARRDERPPVLFPAEEFEAKSGTEDYSGGLGATKAFGLTARGIIGMVPPPGCGASVDCRDWASGKHREVLERPELAMQEPEEDPPEAEVVCDDAEWGPVSRILVGRSVLEVGPRSAIPVFRGRKQTSGMFGVHKKWRAVSEVDLELDGEEERLVKMGWSPKGGLKEEQHRDPPPTSPPEPSRQRHQEPPVHRWRPTGQLPPVPRTIKSPRRHQLLPTPRHKVLHPRQQIGSPSLRISPPPHIADRLLQFLIKDPQRGQRHTSLLQLPQELGNPRRIPKPRLRRHHQIFQWSQLAPEPDPRLPLVVQSLLTPSFHHHLLLLLPPIGGPTQARTRRCFWPEPLFLTIFQRRLGKSAGFSAVLHQPTTILP